MYSGSKSEIIIILEILAFHELSVIQTEFCQHFQNQRLRKLVSSVQW